MHRTLQETMVDQTQNVGDELLSRHL